MLTLLIAAMGKQKRDTCKGYEVSVSATDGKEVFLDEPAILNLMKASTHGNIKGQHKESFNLRQMERLLEENVWVKHAQVWFDSRDVLHISVTEREPVARIFTANGRSFYIDEAGTMMQLSDKVSTRLPVFTGFPDSKVLRSADSLLLMQVDTMAAYISGHEFWNSQVAQIDISPCGAACWQMDMIPVVGSHVVKLGEATDLDLKFNRLMTFYKQVMSRTGFDHYSIVDVRYAGQVVGTRRTTTAAMAAGGKINVRTDGQADPVDDQPDDLPGAQQTSNN